MRAHGIRKEMAAIKICKTKIGDQPISKSATGHVSVYVKMCRRRTEIVVPIPSDYVSVRYTMWKRVPCSCVIRVRTDGMLSMADETVIAVSKRKLSLVPNDTTYNIADRPSPEQQAQYVLLISKHIYCIPFELIRNAEHTLTTNKWQKLTRCFHLTLTRSQDVTPHHFSIVE